MKNSFFICKREKDKFYLPDDGDNLFEYSWRHFEMSDENYMKRKEEWMSEVRKALMVVWSRQWLEKNEVKYKLDIDIDEDSDETQKDNAHSSSKISTAKKARMKQMEDGYAVRKEKQIAKIRGIADKLNEESKTININGRRVFLDRIEGYIDRVGGWIEETENQFANGIMQQGATNGESVLRSTRQYLLSNYKQVLDEFAREYNNKVFYDISIEKDTEDAGEKIDDMLTNRLTGFVEEIIAKIEDRNTLFKPEYCEKPSGTAYRVACAGQTVTPRDPEFYKIEHGASANVYYTVQPIRVVDIPCFTGVKDNKEIDAYLGGDI